MVALQTGHDQPLSQATRNATSLAELIETLKSDNDIQRRGSS